jgi:hypothetical protein
VPFDDLPTADLVVDRVYRGGSMDGIAGDPLQRLLPVGNAGGIRAKGGRRSPQLVALYTSLEEADWPDSLDPATGLFTYYGDNRQPGKELHDTPRGGNEILRRTFELAHGDAEQREQLAPYLLFAKAGRGRDVVFRGLLAPGAASMTPDEDLVAIWRNRRGERFQNYRAKFTVLDVGTVTRAWIDDVLTGKPLSSTCPAPWRKWATSRSYEPLISTRIEYRTPSEQQPTDKDGWRILELVYSHFAERPTDFEHCAARLWQMTDAHVGSYEVTRASVDGGRDAIGEYHIGPKADPVRVTFALEAKLYAPTGGGVGVKEVSRLISRLRHRQFGVLVTTAHVGMQAYKEIRSDTHPIVIMAGGDIITLLRERGFATTADVAQWLNTEFPKQ